MKFLKEAQSKPVFPPWRTFGIRVGKKQLMIEVATTVSSIYDTVFRDGY